uniref:NEDD4-binding protein 2 n=1 Tax=Lygus hesperus TaxID=30085 RepID=A0A0A9YJK3_LYGHE
MKAYAALAVEFGYLIEIVESPNKWAFNENELVRRNVHGVHKDAIRRMLDRYEYHVTPAKLMVECRLTYPQNCIPPQRCLVSFNTPASKNQQKIFNSRFYCVPLDSILSLKSGVDNPPELLAQLPKSRPNFKATSTTVYKNIRVKLKKEEATNPFKYMYDQEIWLTNRANSPPEESSYFVGDPNLYSNPHPTTSFQSRQESIPPQMSSNPIPSGQPHQSSSQDKNIHSNNYFWEKPDQPPKPKIDLTNQMQNSPIDLLLSLDEKTLKALLEKVTGTQQPPVEPTTSSVIENQVSGFFQSKPSVAEDGIDPPTNLNSNPSDSSVDLLSFEDIEVPSSSSDSFVQIQPVMSKADDESSQPKTSSQNLECDYCSSESSCGEAFSDEGDHSNSGSSCEVISLSDDIGYEVTKEYVLVQPTGLVLYQIGREGQPTTLKEFVATSELLSPKKKSKRLTSNYGERDGIQKSLSGKVLSKVSKFVNSSFHKTKGSSSYIEGMFGSTLMSNGSVQSLNTKQSHELLSKSSVGGNVPLPTFDFQNLPPDLPSKLTPISPVPSSTSISNSSFPVMSNTIGGETKTVVVSLEHFQPGLSNAAETWNEEPVRDRSPEPLVRSDSPKDQRSPSGKSLKKTSYDFWCNTNYVDFDILAKVNSGTYTGPDVILDGRPFAFQSSLRPQKFDSIKAVATHDKSSMTSSECPAVGKDSGIEILTRMFPDASTEGLTELFEKCHKDLDWAVNLMIDSGNQVSEHFVADEILPQSNTSEPWETFQEPENNEYNLEELVTHSGLKKVKKSKHKLTEEYSDLVKEFEANFVLNEGCYSERLKKVRETKFGKPLGIETTEDDNATRDSSPSNDQESSVSDSLEEDEGDMGLIMSNNLISQLQSKFGPVPNLFGEDLVVKLPVSLARQIYSYALDSICQHMEEQQNVLDMLVKEDEDFARKLQGQPSEPNGDVSFKYIMDHELALRTQKQQVQSGMSNEPTFASTLSHQLLTERFPGIDPTALKTVLDDTNQSLHQATNLLASAGHVPINSTELGATSEPNDEDLDEYRMSRAESITQANAYHEVAQKLNDLRKHYFLKAQESYNSGNYAVAAFYRDLVSWYTTQIKESNSKAAKTMLCGNEGATTLDLHFLGVSDAVHVLDLFLDEGIRGLSTRKREIFIITGRGLHSADGKSKIKPAIKQRLKQRGLKFSEVNPGMLKTAITKSSTVSYKMDKFQ